MQTPLFKDLDSSLRKKTKNPLLTSFPLTDDPLVSAKKYSKRLPPPLNKDNSDYTKERHIPGYNFCGPGTQVEARLKRGDYGINDLDNACRVHDVEYMVHADNAKALADSDKKLAFIASGIAKKIKGTLEKSTLAKFLKGVGLGNLNMLKMVLKPSKLYEYLAANSVSGVFKGKNVLEKIGVVDPVKFAQGLNKEGSSVDNEIKKGLELYKQYIINK